MTVVSRRSAIVAALLTLVFVVAGQVGIHAATGAWSQTEKLKELPPQASSSFGWSTAVDGDTAVISSPGWFSDPRPGIVYVYEFDGAAWSVVDELVASDGAPLDRFGYSVALSGDVIVASRFDSSAPGQAYVFRDTGSGWVQEAILRPTDSEAGDRFGQSVAISADTIAVSSSGVDFAGGVYVFDYEGADWNQTAKLMASDGQAFDDLGRALAIDDGTIIAGATGAGDGGAAYVFELGRSGWSEQKIMGANTQSGDDFGYAVDVSGDTVVVTAPFVGGIEQGTGVAYVFRSRNRTWLQQAELSSPAAVFFEWFGYSAALSGDRILISQLSPFGDPGAAFIFRSTRSGWVQEAALASDDASINADYGFDVAISDGNVFVSAPQDDKIDFDSGAVYVYSVGSR